MGLRKKEGLSKEGSYSVGSQRGEQAPRLAVQG